MVGARWDTGGSGGGRRDTDVSGNQTVDLGDASGPGETFDSDDSDSNLVDADPSDPGGGQVHIVDTGSNTDAQQDATDDVVNSTGGSDTSVGSDVVDADNPADVIPTVTSGADSRGEAAVMTGNVLSGFVSRNILKAMLVVAAAVAAIVGFGDG